MFWLILSVFAWGILHSLLASIRAKELARRWLGQNLSRFYRLAYNVLAGLSFLPILGIAAVIPDRRLYVVPLPWSLIMGLGQLLAVVMLFLAFKQTDAWEFLGLRQLMSAATGSQLDDPLEAKRGSLVSSGLYKYIRHPLYSAGLAFIWLLPVMTVNILAINLGLTVYILIGAYFEEWKLQRIFGREYVDYAAVTPMFVPFLKGNKKPR